MGVGAGAVAVGDGGNVVALGSKVAVGVASGAAVKVGRGVARTVLVGSGRTDTSPVSSSELSPEQAARRMTAAVSVAMARTRSIAISTRFYRKGGRGASPRGVGAGLLFSSRNAIIKGRGGEVNA
jgi:hypothetical protein